MTSNLLVAIVADDLTGACDSAIQFAKRGLRTYVTNHLALAPRSNWDVWAWNSDSRCCESGEAAARLKQTYQQALASRPSLVFMKIDSMMRGNVAQNLVIAREVLRPPITVLTPAFPALGRIVRNGQLYIYSEPQPVNLYQMFPNVRRSVAGSLHGDLTEQRTRVLEAKDEIVILDASTHEDLESAVSAFKELDGVLWVGSGGLAGALANSMGDNSSKLLPQMERPLLLCVGSNETASNNQVRMVESANLAQIVAADLGLAKTVNAALANGTNVILRLLRKDLQPDYLDKLMSKIDIRLCGGILLTGGDTARYILDAVRAEGIRCHTEVLPGIPQGEIVGGKADGLLVITKSGAFGDPQTLLRCIELWRARLGCGAPSNGEELE